MFRRLGLSSLWKPKNPHSLEYLKYLHEILIKNEQVTENNRKLLVECLRAVAEILIWGDQNESSVFDFFLERQMLEYFLSIMKQNCGSFICVQLLQTLNILFENIRHKTSLYYLLSNNHVNSIITYRFDFENEEIMAYYISFLKTLSFKLNMYTIHFFFNEANQDFPLYTEVIKFQNHSEAMVRIAVRTTTLNIYKVEDKAMRKFVHAHSRVYFCALSDFIARQSIEIDHFARSAENESSNRKRLDAMIDDYLDYMHYLNDILLIRDEKLSAVLVEIVFERLLESLYLSSLGDIRLHPATAILTPVSTLFFLTQFLLIVNDSQAVQILLSSFFFGDGFDVKCQWIRSERATWVLANVKAKDSESRAFFNGYLNALICSRNDHSAFFGLMFIYALCQNKGTRREILEAVQFTSDVVGSSDHNFLNGLLDIITRSVEKDAFIRTITVELCCIVLRQLLLVMDVSADVQGECERRAEKIIASLVSVLTPFVYSDELFLEMFEDEFCNFERNRIHIRSISADSSLLLPPPSTPLNGVSLNMRLPCGSEERTRRNIQLFFHLRRFSLDLRNEEETRLPISFQTNVFVELNDCINLENSDLLACTVITNEKSEKFHRFLVTDQAQLILVEPDNKRMGWAVVRFVGLLQNTQLTSDLENSRALHIIVNDANNRSKANDTVYFNAKFLFDDHIRCMAAKQRLTKGRQMARQCKLDQICDLFGIARKASIWRSNKNPFRIVKGCPPGSLRRQPQVVSSRSNRSSSSSLNIVPDDPEHGTDSSIYTMSDDGPTNIDPEVNSSATYRLDSSFDRDTIEKLTKLTIARNDLRLKSLDERKAREKNMKIARGHQIFKNIESALSDGQMKKKLHGKKERQLVNRLQVGEMALPGEFGGPKTRKPVSSSAITVDELISLFDLACNDHCSMHDSVKFKNTVCDANLCFSDEDWNRFACHVANIGIHGIRGFAVTAVILATRQKGFRSAFAQEINVLMSDYVIFGEKVGQGLPEFVAHLLIANWPREYARCNLESNKILFCIVSSIKGWLETITGETNEIEEIESNCACALYDICRFAQRKFWMKWPELVDECYAAVRDGITLNITLTKEARKALLDTIIMMHEWTSRHAKTLVNVSTQTSRTRV